MARGLASASDTMTRSALRDCHDQSPTAVALPVVSFFLARYPTSLLHTLSLYSTLRKTAPSPYGTWLAMTIYERRLKQKIRRDSWEQFERWLVAQDPRPSAEEEQALRRKQEAEVERLLAELDTDL